MIEIGQVCEYRTEYQKRGYFRVTQIETYQITGIRYSDNKTIYIEPDRVIREMPKNEYPEMYL